MGEWDDYQVMSQEDLDTSEMAAREEFLRRNPPVTGLVVPEDLRKIELIKRPWRNNKGMWFDLADNKVIQAHLAGGARRVERGDASLRTGVVVAPALQHGPGRRCQVSRDPGHRPRPAHEAAPDRTAPIAEEGR